MDLLSPVTTVTGGCDGGFDQPFGLFWSAGRGFIRVARDWTARLEARVTEMRDLWGETAAVEAQSMDDTQTC